MSLAAAVVDLKEDAGPVGLDAPGELGQAGQVPVVVGPKVYVPGKPRGVHAGRFDDY